MTTPPRLKISVCALLVDATTKRSVIRTGNVLNLIFTIESSTFIDVVAKYAALPRQPNVRVQVARVVTPKPRRKKQVDKSATPRSPATNCWVARFDVTKQRVFLLSRRNHASPNAHSVAAIEATII